MVDRSQGTMKHGGGSGVDVISIYGEISIIVGANKGSKCQLPDDVAVSERRPSITFTHFDSTGVKSF